MKPRAHVVLLPVLAAILSTTAIVAATASSKTPRPVNVKQLKKFETNFNQKINAAIRSEKDAASSFAAEKCWKAFVMERVQMVGSKDKTVMPCELSIADKQELRDLVNRRLDDVYLGKLSPRDFMEVRRYDAAWFAVRVMMNPGQTILPNR
jgi:hypothetical protein